MLHYGTACSWLKIRTPLVTAHDILEQQEGGPPHSTILLAPVLMALAPKPLLPSEPMPISYCHMMGGFSVIGYHIIAFRLRVSDLIGGRVVTQCALGLYCKLIRSVVSIFYWWIWCIKQWWMCEAFKLFIYYPLCMCMLSIPLFQLPCPVFVCLAYLPALGLEFLGLGGFLLLLRYSWQNRELGTSQFLYSLLSNEVPGLH